MNGDGEIVRRFAQRSKRPGQTNTKFPCTNKRTRPSGYTDDRILGNTCSPLYFKVYVCVYTKSQILGL